MRYKPVFAKIKRKGYFDNVTKLLDYSEKCRDVMKILSGLFAGRKILISEPASLGFRLVFFFDKPHCYLKDPIVVLLVNIVSVQIGRYTLT